MASGIRGSRATASGSDDEEGRSARYPARRAELDQGCQRGHDRGRNIRRKTRSVLRGEAEGRAESPQKQGFGTKPQFRRAEPGGTFVGEAIYAGLAPEDILVYVERGEGRRNRPPSKASTVAPNVTALGKATQSGEGSRRLRDEPFATIVTAFGKATQGRKQLKAEPRGRAGFLGKIRGMGGHCHYLALGGGFLV